MTASPCFSVIMPSYNAMTTLPETIASVLAQSLDDWELIVADDGSSDAGPEMIARLARHDPRVRLLRLPHGGVSRARNEAIRQAKGRYLAFLDADDVWAPDKLARHAEHLDDHRRVGVSFARVRFMSPAGQALPQYSAVPKGSLSPWSLLTENHVSTSSNIVARREVFDFLGGFMEDMSYAEDQEWLLRVALKGLWQVAGIPHTLVHYRTSAGSLSSGLDRMEKGWLAMLDKVERYAPRFVGQHRAAAQAVYLRYLARRALRQGEPAEVGLAYLRRAWQASPAALLRQPRRSLLTLAGLLAWRFLPRWADRTFLRLVGSEEPATARDNIAWSDVIPMSSANAPQEPATARDNIAPSDVIPTAAAPFRAEILKTT